MRPDPRGVLALLLAMTAPIAPAAEPGTGALFRPGVLEAVEADTTLRYALTRTVPAGAALEPLTGGELTIEVGAERAVTSFDMARRRVTLPASPLSAAHPALLVFLETSTKSIAALTGGSPHYIKNRMIESFQEGPEASPAGADATTLRFRPFDGDRNAGRMGALAGLTLSFALSDAVPGGLASAVAEGGGYREALVFEEATR